MGKIIEVYPCAGKTPHTAPVWQYDYGQILHINGINLPASYNRAGWAVTLERWDGVQLARKSFGAFPDMTPAPEPEPEPEEQGEQ